tara:strand:- start:120 stop:653 length:534 start_codon:yes stop_codon:yes gene_type:complete
MNTINFYVFVERYLNRISSPNSHLIDIGCADGIGTLHLSNKFIVTGIDININNCKQLFNCRCNFKQLNNICDICGLNYNKYDIIYSSMFLNQLPEEQQLLFFQNINYPGTVLCIEMLSDRNKDIRNHNHLFSNNFKYLSNIIELRKMILQSNFNISYCKEINNKSHNKVIRIIAIRK